DLNGYYICADHVSGNWWTIKSDGTEWITNMTDDLEADISTFGVDVAGEIYCADLYSGIIYHVVDACADFQLFASSIDYTCGITNGSIDLSITGGDAPYEISWDTGDETEDITDLGPGLYTVTVTDDIGCQKVLIVTINNVPTFEVTITIIDGILAASAGSAHQWYLNGAVIPGATEQSHVPSENGSYSVLVTDANDCSVLSEEISVTGVLITIPAYIKHISASPNPANENITLEIKTSENISNVKLQIHDATGKLVYAEELKNVHGDFEKYIPVHFLSGGLYHLSVRNENIVWTTNIIVCE
ncbi:MAG: T9SS type A sorting domain-containing protein, partial [Chitinophagales bacterium]|nr:T9SS type A sorting domain-containing protein [Chitinophagales bacterium]